MRRKAPTLKAVRALVVELGGTLRKRPYSDGGIYNHYEVRVIPELPPLYQITDRADNRRIAYYVLLGIKAEREAKRGKT